MSPRQLKIVSVTTSRHALTKISRRYLMQMNLGVSFSKGGASLIMLKFPKSLCLELSVTRRKKKETSSFQQQHFVCTVQ